MSLLLTTRPLFAIAFAALAAGSCSSLERELVCEAQSQCVRDGVQGTCVMPGHCAFEDTQCDSNLRWDSTARDSFAGQCVESEDVGDPNECGGTTVLTDKVGDACGLCDTGTLSCDGGDAFKCDDEADLEMSVTTQGSVTASTEFSSDYRANLAVDLDESTSWFSSGPEGQPTDYTWTATRDECFTNLKIVGNGGHSNSSFRQDFGFGEVTVQVLDASDEVVFSQSMNLDGTPDPTLDLSPNTLGRKVKLLFSGHESDDCGGFGELYVTATR
jgi:hypothetical protein